MPRDFPKSPCWATSGSPSTLPPSAEVVFLRLSNKNVSKLRVQINQVCAGGPPAGRAPSGRKEDVRGRETCGRRQLGC